MNTPMTETLLIKDYILKVSVKFLVKINHHKIMSDIFLWKHYS